MSDDTTAFDHLIRVIGLCQTPRDSWSDEDSRLFREARAFVQKHRKGKSEGKRKEASGADLGERTTVKGDQEAQGVLSGEGLPVEEGAEDPPES